MSTTQISSIYFS